MRRRFLCPLSRASTCMQQSLSGSSGQEPPLSCWITSRLAGSRGGPQGAVSDVGDPTERLTLLPALRLAKRRRCTAPGQSWTAQGVSPDAFDSISSASSAPSNCLRTAGRIAANRLRSASPLAADLGPLRRPDLPLTRSLCAGELGSGMLQVGSRCCQIDLMFIMKLNQLLQHGRRPLASGMAKRCGTGHHLERDP